MIAALYWSINGSDPAHHAAWHAKYKSEDWYTSGGWHEGMAPAFAVPAGELGFSVREDPIRTHHTVHVYAHSQDGKCTRAGVSASLNERCTPCLPLFSP